MLLCLMNYSVVGKVAWVYNLLWTQVNSYLIIVVFLLKKKLVFVHMLESEACHSSIF